MMADNFQIGENVQLKCGGPWMTIESFDVEHQGSTAQGAWCVWFENVKGKRQKQKEWFALTSLNKKNEDQESGFYMVPEGSMWD